MGREKNFVVRCPQCERHVAGTEHGSYYIDDGSGMGGVRYVFLACEDCSQPFVVKQDGGPEQNEDGGYEIFWMRGTTIFPSDLQEMDPSVPANIANSYLEARRVFDSASSYTAAAIMCRRTLEGICKHFAARGGILQKKLDNLRERGIIETKLYEWANDVLRPLGNDAAHDVELVIGRDDATDALDFTKAIIEHLFVFEAAFARFRQRRQKTAEQTGELANDAGVGEIDSAPA